MIYVLDACALIAAFDNEIGADKVTKLLDDAWAKQSTNYMHTVNLIEVHYAFCRKFGFEKANRILEKARAMPIIFIDTIDATIFSESSRLKARYPISLGDSIGLATALKMNGKFVTSDHHELEKVENSEPISMHWFR